LQGSILHRLTRSAFVPWGKSWRYLKIKELNKWLSVFEKKEIQATGFFAAFVSGPKWLKMAAAKLDALLLFIPEKSRYVAFGYAQKQS